MLATVGQLAGGLGLFLIAVRMMTDGLRLAGGDALRDILGVWTRTPLRGLGAGVLITVLVQSSSAVTVATIGFVNAGLLTLSQAIGVVYGSNIGTTMTGWLVALVGFKFKVETFALPLIGLGMALRLTGGERRRGAFGEALAGFGLFFIGIDVLQGAFTGLSRDMDLGALASGGGIGGALLFVGVGFVMTVLTQSSSAAIALTLTAANGGLLTLPTAACMVIGANVGTTSTAAFAVIGATPNAKRVAGAHVLFNGLTGLVALLILPVMLWWIEAVSSVLGLEHTPAVVLALFHTVFNLLGVLLLWPLTHRLAGFLSHRFRTVEEDESRPRFLDRTLLTTPALGLNALTLELDRIGQFADAMLRRALTDGSADSLAELRRQVGVVESLGVAVGEFVNQLESAKLAKPVADALPDVLRVGQHFHMVADFALQTAEAARRLRPMSDNGVRTALTHFRTRLLQPEGPATAAELESALADVDREYRSIKASLLEAGAQGRMAVADMADYLEQVSQQRRMAEERLKGLLRLGEFRSVVGAPEVAATSAGTV